MEYIKLINRFWETNRNTQFTMAETTLYFYLLNEANRNYWQMPIACATAIICASTGMTKATLIRARNGLKKKGLIVSDFEFPVPNPSTLEKINKEKTLGTRFYGLKIGHYGVKGYRQIMDKIWEV